MQEYVSQGGNTTCYLGNTKIKLLEAFWIFKKPDRYINQGSSEAFIQSLQNRGLEYWSQLEHQGYDEELPHVKEMQWGYRQDQSSG